VPSKPLLSQVSPSEIDKALAIVVGRMRVEKRLAKGRDWRQMARPEQVLPAGEWRTWLILAGRGWGKTRTGAEAIHEWVRTRKARRVALVAQTAADARDIMIEGPLSGLMATAGAGERPRYEPSKRRLTWPNGAVATAYSAEDPDSLRGPQFDAAWLDELAAWRYADAYDQLQYGLRLGQARQIVTTTPRPTKVIRELRDDPSTVITRGRTLDNAANLSPTSLKYLLARYEGTRLGRQELDAELLDDVPGAAWKRAWIDDFRLGAGAQLPSWRRLVVGVDPAATSTEGADETGIVAVARAMHPPDAHDPALHEHYYVLEDATLRMTPAEWGLAAVTLYQRRHGDLLVAETNRGGEMVERVLRSVDANISYKGVHATRGKITRAEPVAALYEQGKVHHVGAFPALEDQMCEYVADGATSPDRMDALVWALTELAVKDEPGLLTMYRNAVEAKRAAQAAR
jgi:phage terminase large subunit-like protein